MEQAIKLENLSRTYAIKEGGILHKKHCEVEALKRINFTVSRGELFGLLGPNGAGKTTLVKILATVLLPTSGRAEVMGFDVARQTGEVRRRIGLVFGGERGLYSHLSVKDNLTFWAALYRIPRHEISCRVTRVLNLMGLEAVSGRPVETLSQGMRQRVHLARGLLPDPDVLLLDEPTIGLDPVAARSLRKMIRALHQEGMTIFLTTHYMQEAEELCERIAIIDQGELRYLGTPEELKKRVAHLNSIHLVIDGSFQARLREIEKWPAVRSFHVHESDGRSQISITYSGDTSFVSQIVRLLKDVNIIEIYNREHTLEDAYVSIIGNRGLEVK